MDVNIPITGGKSFQVNYDLISEKSEEALGNRKGGFAQNDQCGPENMPNPNIVEHVDFKNDQDTKYYSELAKALAEMIGKMDPSNPGMTNYNNILKTNFADCSNTAFPEVNLAAKSVLAKIKTTSTDKNNNVQQGVSDTPHLGK